MLGNFEQGGNNRRSGGGGKAHPIRGEPVSDVLDFRALKGAQTHLLGSALRKPRVIVIMPMRMATGCARPINLRSEGWKSTTHPTRLSIPLENGNGLTPRYSSAKTREPVCPTRSTVKSPTASATPHHKQPRLPGQRGVTRVTDALVVALGLQRRREPRAACRQPRRRRTACALPTA